MWLPSIRWAALTALISGALLVPGAPAHAVDYTSYATEALTPDSNTATKVQGFAAIGKFAYSVKITDDTAGTKAVIHRVNTETGARQVLTNTATGKPFIGGALLGHANGMAAVDINGVRHLYVVTRDEASTAWQLIDLAVDATNVTVLAGHHLWDGASLVGISGISVIAATPSDVTFFFKKGNQVYRGPVTTAPVNSNVWMTPAFTLDVPGLAGYSSQSFYYDPVRQVAYAPYTSGSTSVVLMYPGVTAATSGVALTGPNRFRITNGEIEGVGLLGSTMYFNAERGSSDGVFRFTGWSA